MHTCFEACRPDEAKLSAQELEEYKKAFTIDKRPVCKPGLLDKGIMCLDPFLNDKNCEIFQPKT